jgi:uncharacterized protein YjbI with pentapeptide repeats
VVTSDGTVVPGVSGIASWAGCDLTGAKLDGLDLRAVVLGSTNLTNASMVGTNLAGTTIAFSNFHGADLRGADLTGDYADKAVLSGADLAGAQLVGLHGQSVDLTGADLTGAALGGVRLGTVVGEPAAVSSGWAVRGGYLVGPGADLSARGLTGLDLGGVDLTGTSLVGTVLDTASLLGSVLTRADLRGASLYAARLTGATGLATAWADATTTWTLATCPDGKVAEKHDGVSCQGALDTTGPVLTPAVPRSPFAITPSPALGVAVTEKGSGVDGFRLRTSSVRSGSTTAPIWRTSGWGTGSPNPFNLPTADGRRTCFSMQGRDRAGNLGPWSPIRCVDTVYDDSGSGWYREGEWTFANGPYYFETSLSLSRNHGDDLLSDRVLVVKRLGILATTCATCGTVTFYVGKVKVGAISLAAKAYAAKRLILLPPLRTRLRGQVRVVVTSANGRLVRVDGIAVSAP